MNFQHSNNLVTKPIHMRVAWSAISVVKIMEKDHGHCLKPPTLTVCRVRAVHGNNSLPIIFTTVRGPNWETENIVCIKR